MFVKSERGGKVDPLGPKVIRLIHLVIPVLNCALNPPMFLINVMLCRQCPPNSMFVGSTICRCLSGYDALQDFVAETVILFPVFHRDGFIYLFIYISSF